MTAGPVAIRLPALGTTAELWGPIGQGWPSTRRAAASVPIRRSPWLHASAGTAVRVGPLLAAQLSDGIVDPTAGAAVRTLDYDQDFSGLAQEDPAPAYPSGAVPGWWRITLDDEGAEVLLPRGTMLELGATGKALAALAPPTGQRDRLTVVCWWPGWQRLVAMVGSAGLQARGGAGRGDRARVRAERGCRYRAARVGTGGEWMVNRSDGRRLRVDPIADRAHGLCAELVPELISLDEWGYPRLTDGPTPAWPAGPGTRGRGSLPDAGTPVVRGVGGQ